MKSYWFDWDGKEHEWHVADETVGPDDDPVYGHETYYPKPLVDAEIAQLREQVAKLQATIDRVKRCGFMSQEYYPEIHGKTEAGWYFAGEQVRKALSESEARCTRRIT